MLIHQYSPYERLVDKPTLHLVRSTALRLHSHLGMFPRVYHPQHSSVVVCILMEYQFLSDTLRLRTFQRMLNPLLLPLQETPVPVLVSVLEVLEVQEEELVAVVVLVSAVEVSVVGVAVLEKADEDAGVAVLDEDVGVVLVLLVGNLCELEVFQHIQVYRFVH